MRRELGPLAALAMAALISAGCGSNAPSETATATSTGTASSASANGKKKLTARDKAVKFAECIRAHGVSDFPDPDAKNQFQYGVSVSPAVWNKAVSGYSAGTPARSSATACRSATSQAATVTRAPNSSNPARSSMAPGASRPRRETNSRCPAPSAASQRATWAPMPPVPPVTRTVPSARGRHGAVADGAGA